ncbi:LysR family transcriptional regulator [[Clostridium] polysaccharolyticum]|uniref:DNA-binding transcriptional regulator, LysR family n=1 Tax=[Clostridium] polysaccharolyticum TaxID=29364 RepID=A0A1H9ZPH6_9FIRM|nr:LysR family transcriptional regulator [[Clostridium] polysaccharolyticum]SES83116.1 DNA-binding transcriptional regulator, LysR family [[Clostridium] polysaccharolyticum]
MFCNLEYYKNFYYVGKCQSFSGAAELLCISQPAMSQSIRQLEAKLKCDLFIRTSKGVKLTKEGERLYAHVKKGIEEFEAGEQEMKQIMQLQAGEIRIGASDMTLQFFLLPYLEKFHERYPEIKVKVSNGPTPETLDNLNQGMIDFGIVSSPFEVKDDIEILDVKQIEDCFVVGRQLKALSEKELELNELMKHPVICLEENSSTRKYLDCFLKESQVTIVPEFELATSDMIVQFALRNLGIGCVMKEFARKELEEGNLWELRFRKQIPKRKFSIVYGKSSGISHAARKLLELIREEAAEN